MALSRIKKNEVLDEVSGLLDASKLTVLAAYAGTSVKELQELRKSARENSTHVRVIKTVWSLRHYKTTNALKQLTLAH